MEHLAYQGGYFGLFFISFLAATLLPLSSEALAALMTVSGYQAWIIFLVATTANTLGAITNYYVGRLGTDFVLSRYIRIAAGNRLKAENTYRKWGSPVLFFAWLPVIGDPLTVVAGIFKLPLFRFLFWVALGKAFRYAIVIAAADSFLNGV